MKGFFVILCAMCFVGCTVTLPFQHRVAYDRISEIRSQAKPGRSVSLSWVPATFPERVDIQGASGFVGGGSQTRIPMGPGIAQRVIELLDAAVGVSTTGTSLTIEVEQAQSTFEYSAGIFNVTPSIDAAGCTLSAKFTLNGKTWTKTFSAQRKDSQVGGSSQVALLEKVWDDIAMQVCKEIISQL